MTYFCHTTTKYWSRLAQEAMAWCSHAAKPLSETILSGSQDRRRWWDYVIVSFFDLPPVCLLILQLPPSILYVMQPSYLPKNLDISCLFCPILKETHSWISTMKRYISSSLNGMRHYQINFAWHHMLVIACLKFFWKLMGAWYHI